MRTKSSAPHRAVQGMRTHRTEANPAPGTPAPLTLISSPGSWQVPALPGRSHKTGSSAQHCSAPRAAQFSSAQHCGELCSALWAALLSTVGSSIRHHGQLRSAPRTPLLSTMGSSAQHRSAPWAAPAQHRSAPPLPRPPGRTAVRGAAGGSARRLPPQHRGCRPHAER